MYRLTRFFFFWLRGLSLFALFAFPLPKNNPLPAYGQQFWLLLLLFVASVGASC